LKAAGYTRDEVIEMVNNEFETDDPEAPGRNVNNPLYVTANESCGCPSCPEHGPGAKIRVKVG